MITQERLKQLFNYNPATGNFTRKVATALRSKVGEVAGWIDGNYVRISIDNKTHRAHRLAFLYMKGYIPKEIDHIDKNGYNNKWNNLREATRSQNQSNTRNRNNAHGYRGVIYKNDHNRKKPWQAAIGINNDYRNLGHYKTKEEAARAYDKAALEYFGEFANLNFPKESK